MRILTFSSAISENYLQEFVSLKNTNFTVQDKLNLVGKFKIIICKVQMPVKQRMRGRKIQDVKFSYANYRYESNRYNGQEGLELSRPG